MCGGRSFDDSRLAMVQIQCQLLMIFLGKTRAVSPSVLRLYGSSSRYPRKRGCALSSSCPGNSARGMFGSHQAKQPSPSSRELPPFLFFLFRCPCVSIVHSTLLVFGYIFNITGTFRSCRPKDERVNTLSESALECVNMTCSVWCLVFGAHSKL